MNKQTAAVHSSVWQALAGRAASAGQRHVAELFAADPQRFQRFSLTAGDVLLDFSKQRVDDDTLALLHDLWRAADVPRWISRMRAGEPINNTEHRAVLHIALRHSGEKPVLCDGRDVMPDVRAVLEQMRQLCQRIHDGSWRGATGERIRAVVNIGIGGSDLGPKMATQALTAQQIPDLHLHYVSNVDAAHLAVTLAQLDPATTLFVIASKTFTTQETMQNAHSARTWLTAKLGDAAVAKHFIALSTNIPAVEKFGIERGNAFEFWDWVGGRFSLWSAIGLPLALAVGFDNFLQMLAGAEAMDKHFFEAPVERNLPATMALMEVWNANFLGAETRAMLPYSQSLEHLPRYLQQMEMESNGKQAARDGNSAGTTTSPVVWGEPGTNGQHAFYQMIHQGGRLIPCDFVAIANPDFDLPGHREKILANCFAQSEALMRGKTLAEARAELAAGGASDEVVEQLGPYKVFPGNQPSTTILLPQLDAHTLGQLIALYEHKVFTLGAIWNINSFDQWGVEYGKQLANRLLPIIETGASDAALDSSTAGLIKAAQALRKK